MTALCSSANERLKTALHAPSAGGEAIWSPVTRALCGQCGCSAVTLRVSLKNVKIWVLMPQLPLEADLTAASSYISLTAGHCVCSTLPLHMFKYKCGSLS